MKAILSSLALCSLAMVHLTVAHAADLAQAVGDPHLDRSTLHSLGVYWVVRGDDNRNASVRLEYRTAGRSSWRAAAPLWRVEREASRTDQPAIDVPADSWLFVLLLQPGSDYELRLVLADPDDPGESAPVSRILRARTRVEPREPARMRQRYVVPGSGGGRGTASDPFRGLETAQNAALPGDLFLLHPGVYSGHWVVSRSGSPDRPIIWRGLRQTRGQAIIDGQGASSTLPAHAIEASGTHDVWFEDLIVQNARHGVTIHDAARVVVRRCHIRRVDYGINATRNTQGNAQDHFVADNLIEGPSTWPRTKGIEDARGIQLTGEGHVVCYNRIRGFADAIDTFRSPRCAAIDFHNNDLSELTDDGIEMDYSQRNTRCFYNRLTNVFQGISLQPVYGGPVYVFRNVMYNVAVEPFKLHNSPSGGLIFHNTCVKKGTPELLWTPEPVRHCLMRNNLFVGTPAEYAYDTTAPMVECDFDYEGFAGGPFRLFLRWNRERYSTLDDVRQRAPVLRHALQLDAASLFPSRARAPEDVARKYPNTLDLRPSATSRAVETGEILPGWNDGFHGSRPDVGAYEVGNPLPHYGPRVPAPPARQ
jgi:Right handed beta helix region